MYKSDSHPSLPPDSFFCFGFVYFSLFLGCRDVMLTDSNGSKRSRRVKLASEFRVKRRLSCLRTLYRHKVNAVRETCVRGIVGCHHNDNLIHNYPLACDERHSRRISFLCYFNALELDDAHDVIPSIILRANVLPHEPLRFGCDFAARTPRK